MCLRANGGTGGDGRCREDDQRYGCAVSRSVVYRYMYMGERGQDSGQSGVSVSVSVSASSIRVELIPSRQWHATTTRPYRGLLWTTPAPAPASRAAAAAATTTTRRKQQAGGGRARATATALRRSTSHRWGWEDMDMQVHMDCPQPLTSWPT